MSFARYKVLLLGNGGVGKTSLIQRFISGRFVETYKATIGTDIFQKTLTASTGATVELQIWDLSGQQHFSTIRKKFYKKANGALLIFDLTNPETLHDIPKWITEVESEIGTWIPSILVGNKNDLGNLIATGIFEDAKKFGDDRKIAVLFTSAKEGSNVEEAFKKLADLMLPK